MIRHGFKIALIGVGLCLPACTPTITAQNLSEAITGGTFTRQGEYKIGGTDELTVKVYNDDSLSGQYTVSPTGVMTFPLIGFIEAAGLTTLQLTLNLEKALKPYIKNPKLTIAVNSRKSYQVYFSGEVNKPGAVNLESHTTLLQGISVAGSLTKFASGRIVIIRPTPKGTARYATSYFDLLSGADHVDLFTLERGDVVHAE